MGGAGPVEGSEIAPGATLPFERPKFPFLRSAAWGWKCRAASLQSPRGTATATLTALHRDHGLARLTGWPSAHITLAHRRHTKTPQASRRPSECAPARSAVQADARYTEDARASTQVGGAILAVSVSVCVLGLGPRVKGGDLFLLQRLTLSVCDIGLCHICVFV